MPTVTTRSATPSAATSPRPAPPPPAPRHTVVEDVLGLLTGAFLASLGLDLLRSAGAVTGGTAGVALLLGYATPLPFGLVYLAVNLPFFLLALWQKGLSFSLRTLVCVGLVSGLASVHPLALGPLHPAPVYGVLAGNLLCGVGMLVLFRHRSSLGGFNVAALLLQERLGWRAGYVQLVLDVTVVTAALALAAPTLVLLSAAGAALLNLVLALNHRPGRYLAG